MFSRISHACKRFIANEDGPTAVEYAVMIAVIILVCFVGIQAVGTQASNSFQHSGDKIAEAMGNE